MFVAASEYAGVGDFLITTISRFLIGLRVVLNPVFAPYSKLEQKLLTDVRQAVLPEYLDIFDEHVSSVNYIQRDGGYRAARMYQWRFPGYYNWKRSRYFNPLEGISKLVRFTIDFERRSAVHGSIVSIDGVLCSITFGADISECKSWQDFNVRVNSGSICKKARTKRKSKR